MRLLHLLALCSLLAPWPVSQPVGDDAPRLVVLVAIDQLIPEQLERLAPHFDGGLGRLCRAGLMFDEARLDYSMTATGPGHATFSTGCLPRTHGIVGNSMFDRATRASTYCMASPTARPVTDAGLGDPGPAGRGTENMRMPTLGDRLKALDPRTKVVAITGKDRTALAMGGHQADGAFWWDLSAGGFMSSDQFVPVLPTWVTTFNGGWLQEASGWTWERVFDPENPPAGTQADERDGETPNGEFGVTFPYSLLAAPVQEIDAAQRKALAGTVFRCPLVDRFVIDLALDAVTEMQLGADETPDVLAVGLSMCDVVGHGFGPYSHEVTDVILRADDLLGELFDLLDEQVGEGRWVAALTADHGVLPLPEQLVAQGLSARRVKGSESAALRRSVVARLEADFGGDCGLKYALFAFSIDEAEVRAAGHEPAALRAVIAEEAQKTDWVQAAYALEDLLADGATDDPLLRLFRNSSFPGRTPGVALLLRERHLLGMGKGTSHGTAHDYDRRIPLVFYGPGFEAGRRADPCGSDDALPTLLAALGLDPPDDIDGRNLVPR